MLEKIKKALKFTEKYTKTDMTYIAQGGFWLMLFKAAAAAIGFVVTLFLTTHLSKEDFGVYKYVISTISLLFIFSLPGMDNAITLAFSKNEKVSLWRVVKKRIKWSFIGFLVALGLSLYYFIRSNQTLGLVFLLVSPLLPFIESLHLYTAYYRGKKNFKLFSIYQIGGLMVQSLFVILAVLFTDNVLAVVLAFFLGQLISRSALFKMTAKKIDERYDEIQTKEVISYGKKLSLTGVLTTVSDQMDKLMVWHFLGPVMLAGYVVALAFPNAIRGLTGFVTQLSLPKLAGKDWSLTSERIIFYKKIFAYFIFLFAIFVFYTLISGSLIRHFFPEYTDFVLPSIFLGSLIFLAPIRNLLDQLFVATKQIKIMYFYRTVGLVAFVVTFFLLSYHSENKNLVISLALPTEFVIAIVVQIIMLKYLNHEKKK
ncbi:MAG: O-antigen/teichoic acid export membrane protein [Candidatus Paceibacteria bacterium]|jgi:O-antigen/teichoic acid export membrane protein